MAVRQRLERLDHGQQHRPALSIPIATYKKFGEDKSANIAAMMAFWAFFSIFPLLLALVTVLGYVLPDADKKRVLEQVSGYLPLLDTSSIGGLQGNWLALVIGLASALWSGSAVVRVTQDGFNAVWEVPQVERPKFLEQLRRSLLALVTIGLGLLASAVLIGFVSGDNPAIHVGVLGRLLAYVAMIAVDIGLFLVAFRMLTDRQISTRDVLPGAVVTGVAFWILQALSSIIITRHLHSAQATYGTFATVITILWWFYLQSTLTLLGAQLNVVLKRRYYPRALIDSPQTEADHRILADYAEERRYDEAEDINTEVAGRPAPQTDIGDELEDGSENEREPATTAGRHRTYPAASPAGQRVHWPQQRRDTQMNHMNGGNGSVATEDQSTAELVKRLSEQSSRLIRDEIKLGMMEMQQKGKHAGVGAGLLGAAGIVALYGGGALVATCIGLLMLAMDVWAAALIVAGALFAIAALMALIGKSKVSRAVPPAPEQAMSGLKADVETVKEGIRQ
jgi:YihY family inner membrane protein